MVVYQGLTFSTFFPVDPFFYLEVSCRAVDGGMGSWYPVAVRRSCISLLCLFSCAAASLADTWSVADGTTSIRFNHDTLAALGIEMLTEESTAEPYHDLSMGFRIEEAPSLRFHAPGGAFDALLDGSVTHQGGAVLGYRDQTLSLLGFTMNASPVSGLPQITDTQGNLYFYLDHIHSRLDLKTDTLYLMNMDLHLSPFLAGRLGHPGLAGLVVARADTVLSVRPDPRAKGEQIEPPGVVCVSNAGFDVDVELTDLDDLAQVAREAGVRVAMAPSAMLSNVGTHDVRWEWAIAPTNFQGPLIGPHPFLVSHFYRESNGRLQQIGRSDAKHASYAVNSGCPCPGGQGLRVGCSDTYGVGNNSDPFYFAPRDEITAHSGAWQSLGSHFDNYNAPTNEWDDDIRSHGNGAGEHGDFDHVLVVAETNLQTAGARYFIEAWYVVAGDTNIFNSMGYRQVTQVLDGAVWDFSLLGSGRTPGPALNAWVDPTNTPPGVTNVVVDTGEGRIQLAAQTTHLGHGRYRYEYALMNLDYDRQIQSMGIPLVPGASMTHLIFLDVDTNGMNDWVATPTDGMLTWSSPVSNALDWGTLFNFGFEADARPGSTSSVLGILEPGTGSNLAAATLFPAELDAGAGDLFVSSHNSHEVYRYDHADGSFLDIFVTAGSGGLDAPHGLAFGPDRNLYVGSSGGDAILRYNGTSGAFLDAFVTNGSGGLDYPAGILFGPDGHLYVASQLSDEVLRFHGLTGAFMDAFVTNGSGGLDGPSVLVFGPDTNLYVTGRFDNRTYRYDGFSGAFIDVFVTNQLSQPFGCAFGPDTNFYVASGGDNVIRRFDGQTGAYLDDFVSTALSFPVQFLFGPAGDVYACSFGDDTVQRYDGSSGASLGAFITNASGGLEGPNFLAFRPPGTDALDRDGDGMPDGWEIEHLDAGLLAGVSNAPDRDVDGDGAPDQAEYIAHTDPGDSNSFFAVDGITVMSPVEVQFDTATGRVYTVDYTHDLPAQPQMWTTLSNAVQGTDASVTVIDPDDATNRNYRVRVSMP